jgi:hypothetical protein
MTAVVEPVDAIEDNGHPGESAPYLRGVDDRLGSDRGAHRGDRAGDRLQQQVARLSLVRLTRTTAVGVTVVIGIASFVLSFASLCDLAGRTVWPGWLAWLWSVIVDGAIVLATMALVALSAYPEQRGARRYFWALLTVGAAVSVSGNGVHALIPNPELGSR